MNQQALSKRWENFNILFVVAFFFQLLFTFFLFAGVEFLSFGKGFLLFSTYGNYFSWAFSFFVLAYYAMKFSGEKINFLVGFLAIPILFGALQLWIGYFVIRGYKKKAQKLLETSDKTNVSIVSRTENTKKEGMFGMSKRVETILSFLLLIAIIIGGLIAFMVYAVRSSQI